MFDLLELLGLKGITPSQEQPLQENLAMETQPDSSGLEVPQPINIEQPGSSVASEAPAQTPAVPEPTGPLPDAAAPEVSTASPMPSAAEVAQPQVVEQAAAPQDPITDSTRDSYLHSKDPDANSHLNPTAAESTPTNTPQVGNSPYTEWQHHDNDNQAPAEASPAPTTEPVMPMQQSTPEVTPTPTPTAPVAETTPAPMRTPEPEPAPQPTPEVTPEPLPSLEPEPTPAPDTNAAQSAVSEAAASITPSPAPEGAPMQDATTPQAGSPVTEIKYPGATEVTDGSK